MVVVGLIMHASFRGFFDVRFKVKNYKKRHARRQHWIPAFVVKCRTHDVKVIFKINVNLAYLTFIADKYHQN